MSIQVTNLTKVYGSQRAVDGISFTLRPGEIVGFLGPNGAGKSTTMKNSDRVSETFRRNCPRCRF
ncbi:ATP-binding cassette domain-containing protein [Dyadobacter sp. NIV53]|uniref:ATP-binding cassette domain-containing protein n=1 Tax=Dyadobacter sp. NIV53 TaxID=2861765 RepID=UPI00286DCF69|nr:ATP-binding cassette domain-containing protein [Dyadobacter sp. NIV53]